MSNQQKDVLVSLVASLLVAAALFVAVTFITWEWNPAHWSIYWRGLIGGAWLVVFLACLCACESAKSNNPENTNDDEN